MLAYFSINSLNHRNHMSTHDPIWTEPVSQLKLKPAHTCSQDASIKECVDEMQKQKASFIVLTDDNERLTGVFTEHDVMNAYVGTNLPGETMIGAIMNRRMNTTTPSTSLREVINVMGANRVSQLPVLENDKIKGILTVEAIWEHLGENFPDELLNLPPRCDTSSLLQNGG